MRANDLIWSSVVQPLSARPAGPAVGPALLVRGRRAHPRGLPQELQPRSAAQQQPEGAGRLHGRRRRHRPRRDHHADAGHRAQGRSRLGVGSGLRRRAAPRRRFRPRRLGPQRRGRSTRRPPTSTVTGPTRQPAERATEWLARRDPARGQLVAVVDRLAWPARQRKTASPRARPRTRSSRRRAATR